MDLVHLPVEIQCLICDYLTPHDLTNTVRVSKTFNEVLTPRLWRDIKIATVDQYRAFTSPDTEAGLTKYGHHVRTIETMYYWTLKHLFCQSPDDDFTSAATTGKILCTGLTSLTLSDYFVTYDPCPPAPTTGFGHSLYSTFEIDMLLAVLRHSSGLVSLRVPRLQSGGKELLEVIASNLRQLRILSLTLCYGCFGTCMEPDTLKNFLEDCPETIESIDIVVDLGVLLRDVTIDKGREHIAHPNLRKLAIKGGMHGNEEYVLLPFLQGCTSLKSIQTPGMRCFLNKTILDVLTSIGVHPEEIVVKDSYEAIRTMQDDIPMRLINLAGQRMKVLDLEGAESIGEATGATILANCQSLKILNLPGCGCIPSSTMHAILCAATELEEYHTSYEGENPQPFDPHLQAMDVIQSKWGCQNLRLFNAEIQGVPRPDVNLGNDGFPLPEGGGPLHQGTLEESLRIQREIYQQLGALTRLRTLGLGHDDIDTGNEDRFEEDATGDVRYIDDYFQLTCLSMTLESGLDLLSGLKELKVLDVRRMAHRIGIPELDWMKVNWPRLRTIRGMFQEGYEGEPGVREWLGEQEEPRIEFDQDAF